MDAGYLDKPGISAPFRFLFLSDLLRSIAEISSSETMWSVSESLCQPFCKSVNMYTVCHFIVRVNNEKDRVILVTFRKIINSKNNFMFIII